MRRNKHELLADRIEDAIGFISNWASQVGNKEVFDKNWEVMNAGFDMAQMIRDLPLKEWEEGFGK